MGNLIDLFKWPNRLTGFNFKQFIQASTHNWKLITELKFHYDFVIRESEVTTCSVVIQITFIWFILVSMLITHSIAICWWFFVGLKYLKMESHLNLSFLCNWSNLLSIFTLDFNDQMLAIDPEFLECLKNSWI